MTELICKTDSSVRFVQATVLSCEKHGDHFHVVPDRSVLYPGGGGQPADGGTIGGLEIRGLVLRPDGALEHVVDEPVEGIVDVVVDWSRRIEYMQQHTAQHLVTAIAGQLKGWKTTAFHLNPERSDIEFDMDSIIRADVDELEDAVNQVIFEDRPITISFVSREQMATMNVRSRLLPDGLEGPFRLVGIEGIDLNTCGGTHVASTGQVQVVKMLGIERLTRGIRVHYAAGGRVRRIMAQMQERELAIGMALTTGPGDFVASIDALWKTARDAENAYRALAQKMAVLTVERLTEMAQADGIAVHHQDEPDGDFLRQVAERFRQACPDRVALLTGGVAEGLFMVVGPDEVAARLGPVVARVLDGRGGGRGGIFQGRAKSLSLWNDAVMALKSAGQAAI